MADAYTHYYAAPTAPFYLPDNTKAQVNNDLFSTFSYPADVPHPDLFESELDSQLASCGDIQFGVGEDTNDDIFSFLRSETPIGPRSTFSISTESASGYDYQDTLSAHSESVYSYSAPQVNTYPPAANFPFAPELEIDFNRMILHPDDASSYGPLSSIGSSPVTVPNIAGYSPSSAYSSPRGSFSDYQPNTQIRIGGSGASDYTPQQIRLSKYEPVQSTPQTTVAPESISSQLSASSVAAAMSPKVSKLDQPIEDPKRKYPCPNCHRAFARAYNLKTHIQTHDPNRAKPYACHHGSCGRSFSRKHDLTRHLISIHRSESEVSAPSPKAVGIERGNRTWCDSCGKSWVGEKDCNCDVK